MEEFHLQGRFRQVRGIRAQFQGQTTEHGPRVQAGHMHPLRQKSGQGTLAHAGGAVNGDDREGVGGIGQNRRIRHNGHSRQASGQHIPANGEETGILLPCADAHTQHVRQVVAFQRANDVPPAQKLLEQFHGGNVGGRRKEQEVGLVAIDEELL